MIIDSHTHIGNNEILNFSVDELLKSMDNANIDKALVYAAPMFGISNDDLIKNIANHRDRLYPVFTFSLVERSKAYDLFSRTHNNKLFKELTIDKAAEHNAVGIKFYTCYDKFYPHDVEEIIRLNNNSLKLPIIFHCGDTYSKCKNAKLKYGMPIDIDDLATDFPETKFVIAHLGFPFINQTAAVLLKNKNVYADTSGFVYGKFSAKERISFWECLNKIQGIVGNLDQIVFGSDAPISSQKSYIEMLSEFKCNNNLSGLEHFSSTAQSVFNIK